MALLKQLLLIYLRPVIIIFFHRFLVCLFSSGPPENRRDLLEIYTIIIYINSYCYFHILANGLYSYYLNYCYIRSIQLVDSLQNMLRATSSHCCHGCLDIISLACTRIVMICLKRTPHVMIPQWQIALEIQAIQDNIKCTTKKLLNF